LLIAGVAVFQLLTLPIEKMLAPQNEIINLLSAKQKVVLKYILHGLNAKEIANKMHLSYRTIEFHTDTIKKAFNASSKSELISIAIKENLMGIFF